MNEQMILEQVLKLDREAKQRIVSALLEDDEPQLGPGVEDAITRKLQERRKAYLEGRSKTYSPKEAIDHLRETINARINSSSSN